MFTQQWNLKEACFQRATNQSHLQKQKQSFQLIEDLNKAAISEASADPLLGRGNGLYICLLVNDSY